MSHSVALSGSVTDNAWQVLAGSVPSILWSLQQNLLSWPGLGHTALHNLIHRCSQGNSDRPAGDISCWKVKKTLSISKLHSTHLTSFYVFFSFLMTVSFWQLGNHLLPHPFHSSNASCEQPRISQQEQRAPLLARGTGLSSRLQQRRDYQADTNGYEIIHESRVGTSLLLASLSLQIASMSVRFALELRVSFASTEGT